MKIHYNTAYYNLNLLNELDFIIGGYGQAKPDFIFSLNNFIESYVLNEKFLISKQEWDHYFLMGKAFPNGRPITELVFTNKHGIQIIGFPFYMERGKAIYIENANNGEYSREEENKLINSFKEKNEDFLISNYFKDKSFNGFNQPYNFLLSSFQNNPSSSTNRQFFVFETSTTPKDLLDSLHQTLQNSNFQTTLPLGAFDSQIQRNKSLSISNESVKILSDLHATKIEEISKYTGYSNIKIPPLVPILLSQCKTIDDIPDKLIQLRNDFTDLRNSFIKFEKELAECDTINKQITIIESYKIFWQSFHKKYKMKTNRLMYHFWDLESKSGASEAIENSIDEKETDNILKDLKISKVAGLLTSKAYAWHKERKAINRFKGITNLWDLFQNSPTLENQVKDIERIFKLKINPQELSEIANKLKK